MSSAWVRCVGSRGYSYEEMHGAESGAPDELCAACRKAMVAAEAARPMAERTWLLYAGVDDKGLLRHFWSSTMQVQLCARDKIVLTRVRVDSNGSQWGWYRSYHPINGASMGHVTMIYPLKMLVEMCFAYGTAPEVKRGHGQLVSLSVEVIRPAVHPEGIRYDKAGGETVEKG